MKTFKFVKINLPAAPVVVVAWHEIREINCDVN